MNEEVRAGLAWRRLCPAQASGHLLTLAPAPPLQAAFESEVSEFSISQGEINLALRNLQAWMKDEKVAKNLVSGPGVG